MIYRFGEHELDEERLELRCAGATVPVPPKVLDTLLLLVRQRDRVISKSELMAGLWPTVDVSEASVWRAIMEARRAIGDDLQQVIVTVRGRGFRFAREVDEGGATFTAGAEPTVDPTFVGRAAYLAALEARLDGAFAGRGGLVWLFGEAGVGKTRIAEELARRAGARGAASCIARATEAPDAPAYWIWTQLVRASGGQAIAPGPQPSGAERVTMFQAVASHFVEASRSRPLLLVLDDLQWADEESLDLLSFLARDLVDSSLCVVGVYRDTALGADARSRRLQRLSSEHVGLPMPVRGLTRDEVARVAELASGSVPSETLVDALVERSGGNAFYVQQLLRTDWADRALSQTAMELATSMDLQQDLIESIFRHVSSLSDGVRELLTTSAVIGRELDLAKLAVVSDASHDELLDRLDEAVRARVLMKARDGRFRFAHSLVREVLYKKLSGSQRASRHRAVADKLLAHYADSLDVHAAEIARHLARALPGGDPLRVVELSIRAAEQQTSIGAHVDAARSWQMAARALDHVRGHTERRLEVQLGLGRARARGGEAGAREAFLDAVLLARTCGRAEQLAEAAIGFATASGNELGETREALLDEAESALARAPANVASGLLAQIQAARSAGAPEVVAKLAPRVQQTLDLLLTGAANKEIAQELGISTLTVQQYVKVLFKSFGVASRTELIAKRLGKQPR